MSYTNAEENGDHGFITFQLDESTQKMLKYIGLKVTGETQIYSWNYIKKNDITSYLKNTSIEMFGKLKKKLNVSIILL